MFDVVLNARGKTNVDFRAVYENECGGGVNQNDSVSNIGSKQSHKSVSSGRSSL